MKQTVSHVALSQLIPQFNRKVNVFLGSEVLLLQLHEIVQGWCTLLSCWSGTQLKH